MLEAAEALIIGARVAHGDGQGRHLGSDAARLEDDQQAGSVSALGQHACHEGQTRADKDRAAIFQQTGSHAGQQFGQVVTILPGHDAPSSEEGKSGCNFITCLRWVSLRMPPTFSR